MAEWRKRWKLWRRKEDEYQQCETRGCRLACRQQATGVRLALDTIQDANPASKADHAVTAAKSFIIIFLGRRPHLRVGVSPPRRVPDLPSQTPNNLKRWSERELRKQSDTKQPVAARRHHAENHHLLLHRHPSSIPTALSTRQPAPSPSPFC